jgi:hypothetical protein
MKEDTMHTFQEEPTQPSPASTPAAVEPDATASEPAAQPEMKRTFVWALLELEHDTDEADADLYVFEALDNGVFKDTLKARARDFGSSLRVLAVQTDLVLMQLLRWAADRCKE